MAHIGVDLRHVKAGGHIQLALAQVQKRRGTQLFLLFHRDVLARRTVLQICAQLHLDEHQHAVLHGDEVDLAEAAAPLSFHDAAAALAQILFDQRLAPVAVLLRAHRRASHFLRNVMRCTGLGPY